jgi:hypothetical protein
MTRSGTGPTPLRRALLAAAAGWPLPGLTALAGAPPQRVLTVGPGASFSSLAAAVQASADGDRIDLLPGTYRGNVAVVERRSLTIGGLGAGAVLDAAGQHAAGKGILVVRGDVTLENITFRGARVPDGNGAGVRFDHGRLVVRRCRFIDNEMGLLSGNEPDSTLHIEDSVFADAPRHAGALHHLLYAGRIARLTLQGCRFENGWRGHLVKSRARENHIVCNLLRDGPQGGASYELELAEGGSSVVSGNVLVQSRGTQNPRLLALGFDADPARPHGLVLVHNTFVNVGPAGNFLTLATSRLGTMAPLLVANNLLVGPGATGWPAAADGGGNLRLPLQQLQDAAGGDYRPLLCAAPATLPTTWQPRLQLRPPLGTRPLDTPPACAGALAPAG